MTDPTPAPGVLSAPTRKEKVHGICKWDASECKETWHEEGNSGARPYTQPFEASRIAPNLGFAFAPHPRQNVDLNKWGNCHKEWDSDGLGWGNITPDEEIFDSTLQIDRTHQVRKHTAGALTNKLPYCGDIISGSYIDPGAITPCQGSEIPPLSLSMDNSCKLFDGNQFCNHKYMKYKHTYSDGTKIEKYYQCALDGSSERLSLPKSEWPGSEYHPLFATHWEIILRIQKKNAPPLLFVQPIIMKHDGSDCKIPEMPTQSGRSELADN